MDIPKIACDAAAVAGRRKPWTQPRKQQSVNNYLLQLPHELILCINDFLEPPDLVLFTQTCYAMRIILEKHLERTNLNFSERLQFLVAFAREQPEKWVCKKCVTLHPIRKRDTPSAFVQESSCTRMREYGRRRYDTRLLSGQIRVEHRHIQLALKYTRLQDERYNRYLGALLAPYHDRNFHDVLKTFYSAYPKVVMAYNGDFTYLLLSTWRYYGTYRQRRGSFDDFGSLQICPHITVDHGRVVEVRAEGGEFMGACDHCATDFSIEPTSDSQCLDVRVWQDFGPEGSPIDLAWQSHRYWHRPNNQSRKPGTIRKLYEEDEKCGSRG
ncbi:hypothetical protein O1611_g4416 [Lasiodiplodia mahajangana]|uniref:Uncharacterized protein n=1 Tax=Lasiodiplodia mahajangana TaxID=1108764 RepID=A0ACC2JNZ5_9PEZI|nr:hypothetical protein O1611_g4416 [Lasiodiplodia mahajangana]